MLICFTVNSLNSASGSMLKVCSDSQDLMLSSAIHLRPEVNDPSLCNGLVEEEHKTVSVS